MNWYICVSSTVLTVCYILIHLILTANISPILQMVTLRHLICLQFHSYWAADPQFESRWSSSRLQFFLQSYASSLRIQKCQKCSSPDHSSLTHLDFIFSAKICVMSAWAAPELSSPWRLLVWMGYRADVNNVPSKPNE